ncbi:hypothetical protein BT69DRAFT_1329290 [Atractiella rhizophila]|nr:hypothetical protein BT69DRAFT_1329290 [Atractiella rhizophila]
MARKNNEDGTSLSEKAQKKELHELLLKQAKESGYHATRYLLSQSQSLTKSLNANSNTNSTLALSSLHLISLVISTTADDCQPLDEDDEFVQFSVQKLDQSGIGGAAGITSFVKLWFETRKQYTLFPSVTVERLRYLSKAGATIVKLLIKVGELEEFEEGKIDSDFMCEDEGGEGAESSTSASEEDARELNQAMADAMKERRKEDGTVTGKTRAQKKKEKKKQKKRKVPGGAQVETTDDDEQGPNVSEPKWKARSSRFFSAVPVLTPGLESSQQ